eukprot:9912523-Lingulodinium_polyedra.AAC.1
MARGVEVKQTQIDGDVARPEAAVPGARLAQSALPRCVRHLGASPSEFIAYVPGGFNGLAAWGA